MIAVSMVAMYLLSYLNSWDIFGHAMFSETRLFMVMMMGATMSVIMLAFMLGMYRNTKLNIAIFIGAAAMFALALGLVRSQRTVGEVDYMEGMIPHHSIAILTSNRAQISDLRVRELADEIIAAQNSEIRQMSWLLEDIQQNGEATTRSDAERRAAPEF